MKVDPLGVQPFPTSGTARPDWSSPRVAMVQTGLRGIWVEHPPQEHAISALRLYVAASRGIRGVPLSGRRLSQLFQAGKSAIAWRLKTVLAEERRAAGQEPNPHQVVIVTINRRMTLKQLYQAILALLADDFHALERLGPSEREREARRRERQTSETLQRMLADWVVRLGVELLVVDEVQRLDRASEDALDLTEELQTFCDRGVVPLLLVGNEKSEPFLRGNRELAVRLGTPLELKPLDMGDDDEARQFIAFCSDFDRQLRKTSCMPCDSGLGSPAIVDALYAVSSGHVGRVARVLQEAVPHAAARGAALVEPHDLSRAVRDFAIPLGWIDRDPFSARAGGGR